MRSRPLLVVIAGALGIACSDPSRVTLTGIGTSPVGSFSLDVASVPVGAIVGFAANGDAVVTASVDDTTVATVTPTTETAKFVMVGVASGQTTLRVYVNSEETYDVPVQVADQTVP